MQVLFLLDGRLNPSPLGASKTCSNCTIVFIHFDWNARLARFVTTMQHKTSATGTFSPNATSEHDFGWFILLFKPSMHVQVYKVLKRVDTFIDWSCKVDVNPMSMCVVPWLTCMQTVGALRMLRKCSTRCPHRMQSLGVPLFWDMWNVKLWEVEKGMWRSSWMHLDWHE